MARTFSPTQKLAKEILEGIFGQDNVLQHKGWKFSIIRPYFYGPKHGLQGFINRVGGELKEVPGIQVLDHSDNFQAWPKLSYYALTIQITDTEAFFRGPEPKAEEVTQEPAAEVISTAPTLDLTVNFELPATFADRKAFRRAIRNLAADHNAEYQMHNHCYLISLDGQTWSFGLTDEGETKVIRL